jgi:lactoylglutathione lyase
VGGCAVTILGAYGLCRRAAPKWLLAESGGRRRRADKLPKAACQKERPMQYVHTCYRVLDLEKSIDFYTNKLGLELARKTPVGDDATNAFFAVPGDPEPRLEDRLEEAGGVDFESKPHAMGSGTRIFFVKDPDGYRIEFIERR